MSADTEEEGGKKCDEIGAGHNLFSVRVKFV